MTLCLGACRVVPFCRRRVAPAWPRLCRRRGGRRSPTPFRVQARRGNLRQAEADPGAGRVSFESAMGRALLGHRVGEEVQVHAPAGGIYTVRILQIE